MAQIINIPGIPTGAQANLPIVAPNASDAGHTQATQAVLPTVAPSVKRPGFRDSTTTTSTAHGL
jgi:hypothetical protein